MIQLLMDFRLFFHRENKEILNLWIDDDWIMTK